MLGLINARLSIRGRLVLIGALFLAPIALLVYLFVNQSFSDINFAEREIDGTRYLADLWPSYVKTAMADAVDKTEITSRAAFDAEFGSAATSSAYADAKTILDKLEAGKALIGDVADKSNLTLDPDLDSFYAMDAATVRLPGILSAAVALKKAFAESGDKNSRIVDIAFAVSHLQTSSGDAQSSLGSSIKANAAGITGKALSAPAAALQVATDAALANGNALLAAQAADDLPRAVDEVIAKVDAIWAPTNAEVARLLQVRLDGFYSSLFKNLGIAAAFVFAAMALSLTIASGLSRRLTGLLEVMGRLTANDANVDVPYLTDANETGKIAGALAAFKESVIERSKLKSDKALQAELEAERAANERQKEEAQRRQADAVTRLAQGLNRLAQGDLSVALSDGFDGGYVGLRDDYNAAIAELSETVSAVVNTIQAIGATSQQMLTASGDLARRVEQQAGLLEDSAEAMRELSGVVERTADASTKTKEIITSAKRETAESLEVVRKTVTAIERINGSSDKIGAIVGVIDEIAFQTNLLALNAGVEAARAGDAGRGFAVVASEVRALAQRSADAAKEINALISSSASEVVVGVDLVKATGVAFERVKNLVSFIDGGIADIASQAVDQSNTLKKVNMSISEIDQSTQQNAAMAEQASAACQSLNLECARLEEMASKFRLTAESNTSIDPRSASLRGPSRSAA